MVPQKKLFYFGYGQNSSPEMMQAITGKYENDLVSYETELDGYELCIQTINDLPPISQSIIRKAWSDGVDSFRSYVIRPKEGSKVKGRVYVLSEEEREMVKNFELVDFGWHNEENIEVLSVSKIGKIKAETEVLGVSQTVSDVEVDGLNYEPFLNPKDMSIRIAESAREEFLNRKLEGNIKPTEIKG